MSSADTLVVSYGERTVGALRSDPAGALSFAYAREWLQDESSFAISVSLPLGADEVVGGPAHAFFANLLPEGVVRQSVCQRLGISSDNDFALLRAIGGECAGALSITGPGQPRPDPEDQRYQELNDRQLQDLVTDDDTVPLLIGGPTIRLSLAGAQDKIPVALLDGKLHLPLAGAPSTHIIKLPQRRFAHLTANEAFVTGLARRIGLPVVEATLYRGTDPPSLLVARYDRPPSDEAWPATRLHQEDLCQALGLPPSRKYEQEGGPTLVRAIELVRANVREPLVDVRRLIEWQAFHIVAGDSDGHGKNLSLLYAGDGAIRLAPFYDLVSTRHYDRLDPNLAMGVGGRRNPDQIARAQWDRLAAELSVAAPTVRALVRGVAEQTADVLAAWTAEFREREGAHPILEALPRRIARRAKRVRDSLA